MTTPRVSENTSRKTGVNYYETSPASNRLGRAVDLLSRKAMEAVSVLRPWSSVAGDPGDCLRMTSQISDVVPNEIPRDESVPCLPFSRSSILRV